MRLSVLSSQIKMRPLYGLFLTLRFTNKLHELKPLTVHSIHIFIQCIIIIVLYFFLLAAIVVCVLRLSFKTMTCAHLLYK